MTGASAPPLGFGEFLAELAENLEGDAAERLRLLAQQGVRRGGRARCLSASSIVYDTFRDGIRHFWTL